jgi:hypothetical protein
MNAPPPPALAAFLRGIERRARTLAEAQGGDAALADAIWRDTADDFATRAAATPIAGWPVLFWSRLLAHRGLATPAPGSPLVSLGPGPRAALLLRLVAGLDPRPAAEVLGVSEPTYRFALQRALEQARAAGIDADALRQWREAWQRAPTTVVPPRPPADATPSMSRDDSEPVSVPLAEPVAETPPPTRLSRKRRLLAAGAVAAIAVVAMLFWPAPPPPATRPEPQSVVAPAPTPPTLATHPDYALLAAGDDERLAADVAFYSWLAASPDAAPAAPAEPAAAAPAVTP